MLPNVKITFANGAMGSVTQSADNVGGLICSAVAVSGKMELGKAYILYKLADLADMGVTSAANDANAVLYKTVKEFYAEAGDGKELWLMGVEKTVKASEVLNKDDEKAYGKQLIKEANGRLRYLMVVYSDSNATIDNEQGIDSDVIEAKTNGQALAEWATEEMYAPLFVLIEGRGYDKTKKVALPDLTQETNNRVGILVGDTQSNSKGACLGVLGGRIAKISVEKHIGRVKDGALSITSAYIGDDDARVADKQTLNNKGYITLRTFVGKSGYFFTDDSLATSQTDDYSSIARRRVIDKAYRVVYETMLGHINEEVPVTNEGYMDAAMCKSWEQEIVSAIYNQMTINKELSVDSSSQNDKGVKAYIDPKQRVLVNNRIELSVQVKPYGYAKYIDVELGFLVKNN